jgi:hypothetical protein
MIKYLERRFINKERWNNTIVEGKQISALFLLIEKLIEENSENNQTLDFGG